MQENISLDSVIEYIRRDPASWKGISLLYARAQDNKPLAIENLTQQKAELLSFRGKQSDFMVLGLGCMPDALPQSASACYWVRDIGSNRRLADSILTILCEESGTPSPMAIDETNRREKPLSILIVEDDPIIIHMAAHHLERFGTVIRTTNAREAVANYMVHRPDIIFLDIYYQDDRNDGFDVLQNLLLVDKHAFVVMVSGDRAAGTVLKACALGAQGFIAKPFQASDFNYYLDKRSRQTE